ncbi:MAG: hypothetical protein II067_05410 [Agathobacter sp.]|uniref:hypothetical protein n=1 Tax=Agathobacter sp. TaxID=2021311 RepID=UPI00257FBC23|nr:hypothetical protein [Agathobacter sp.]MBQ1681637.1 hypothetical protein [Agathobacter sp.]
MKSKVNSLVDYKTVKFETKKVLKSISKDEIDKYLHQVVRKNKKTIQPESIEKGDIVTLKVESAIARYNKQMVPVTVGSYMYSEELEKQLIGMKKGECKTLTADGEAVETTVLSITRTIFPEPTDEAVRAYVADIDELNHVQSISELISYLNETHLEEEKVNAKFEAIDEVIEYVLTHSDFDFDEDEIQAEFDAQMESFREGAKEELGKELDELTNEDFQIYAGVASREELEAELRQGIEWQIATMLWVATTQNIDTATLSIEEDDIDTSEIEAYITSKLEFVQED